MLMEKLNSKLLAFENRLASLDDKIESTRLSVDQLTVQQKLKQGEILQQPVDHAESLIPSAEADEELRDGFINDIGIQAFRRGWITFQAKKYPESILIFSEFVDRYPDHLLAGSAQYYLAKSYLSQKEYKLAAQEYQKILGSYEHDPHITDTLRDLVLAEEGMKAPEAAGQYRQHLTTLFPQSPATWSLAQYSEKPVLPESAIESAAPELVKADNQKIQNQAANAEMKAGIKEKETELSKVEPPKADVTKTEIAPTVAPTQEPPATAPVTAPIATPQSKTETTAKDETTPKTSHPQP